MSRTVLDTALFLDLTAGGSQEKGAPPPPDRPFVDAARSAPGALRIAFSTKPARLVTPPVVGEVVKNAVRETGDVLASLGHQVTERDPDWGNIGNHISARYLRGIHDDVELAPHRERLERRTRGYGRIGGLVPESAMRKACAAAAADWRRVGRLFDDFDVLMTPVMGGTALPVRRFEGASALRTLIGQTRFYCFAAAWNHLGNPAAAVPAGFADDGMPLAVMLIGRPNDEATLLSLAAQLEAERPWADQRPTIS